MPARRLPVVPDDRARRAAEEEGAAPHAARRRRCRSPCSRCPRRASRVHMMGIGGTGVVTVNQILGTAAMLDGKHVRGLDQTGLSQKGGPVVSRTSRSPRARSTWPTRSRRAAPISISGFDLLVATDPVNLDKAESGRTIAVVSTSRIPTGQMVQDTAMHFPELERHADRHRPRHAEGRQRLPRRARHGGGALRRPHGDQPDPDGRGLPGGRAADLRRVDRARHPAERRVGRDEPPRVPVGAHGGGRCPARRGRGEDGLRPGGRGRACCPPRRGPSSTRPGSPARRAASSRCACPS